MMERTPALLVHHNSETLATLKGALERQGMRTLHAESHAQAKRLLGGLNPAPLVFTDTQLPDGTWADILALADKAPLPVNVIVVARLVDTRFYVEAIEAGAFDFIAPPFVATDLAYVVRSALDNVAARRAARPPSAHTEEEALLAEVQEPGTQTATN
ncbi:MAG: response regulator [Terriglobia bacterium]|jgi:two-component system response regulator PilR (NtrC family)